MLLTSCRKKVLLRFSFSSGFRKPSKINRLQTKNDSIPIAVRSGAATSLHPPQRQRPPSNGLIERAQSTVPNFDRSAKTHIRLITSVYHDWATPFLVG
jgi:hypothetical protein